MATSYPTGLDTFSTLTDNVDAAVASQPNNLGDAIEQIQIKLGVDSSSVNTTIDYFLKHASGAYRLHQHDGGSDDGALLDWDFCWADAVHTHASAAEGGLLDWDTCWIDAVHSHASTVEGGTLDWDNCWADAVHSHASTVEGGLLDWDTCWADAVHSHTSNAEGGILAFFGTIDTTTYNRNTNYQAISDGSVFGYDRNAEYCNTICYTDSSATPTRVVQTFSSGYSGGYGAANGFCFPVKKGDYFRVDTTGATRREDGDAYSSAGYKILWMPLGS